ncbi:MAG: IPT/TIG domain-containing protein, partial [Ignavibacteriae bacterium]|nr:IPT/TIG domain-containing protein [Ignavibacteriota bacterium]
MKIKPIIYIVLFFASLILISSCSETTSTNDAPSIISLSKTTVVTGETITITGLKFGSVRNNGYVSFNGIQASGYTSWSDTLIVVVVPGTATSGNVIVYAGGKQSNAVAITILKNYFPNAVGNYWVYETFELDTAGNRDNNTREVDSVLITGTWNFLGKNSDIYTKYTGSSSGKEYYYYTEGGKYYTNITNVMPPKLPFPIDYQDAWIVIANPDSTSWTIFSQELKDVEMDLPGGQGKGTLNGTFIIKGEKGLNQTMTTGENSSVNVNAQEYKLLYSYNGTITVIVSGIPVPINMNFTVTEHQWYGENIGLILDRVDPTTIQISVFYTYYLTGME